MDAEGRFVGRDLTGRYTGAVVDLRTVSVAVHAAGGGMEAVPDSTEPAPWPRNAYLVVADGGPTRVVLRTADGHEYRVDYRVVAELLKHDPEHSPDAPIVWAVDRAGDLDQTGVRSAADALGVPSWAADGIVRMLAGPDGASSPARVHSQNGAMPLGQWTVSAPGLMPPDEDSDEPGQWLYEEDGTRHWVLDHDLITRTIPHHESHESTGRSFHAGAEWAGKRETRSRHLLEATGTVHGYETDGEFIRTGEGPKPWVGMPRETQIYVFTGHGDKYGRTWWRAWVGDDPVDLWSPASTAGQYLRRRPSLARMRARASAGRPVVVLAMRCETASLPVWATDPLSGTEPAQEYANHSGVRVLAPTWEVSTAGVRGSRSGLEFRLELGPQGEPGRWIEFRPEPGGERLARLAWDMGLPTGPGRQANDMLGWHTLRLVRALRRVFGPQAEEDVGLVRGIGALERLRRADPVLAAAGPFTMAFFDLAARELLGRSAADKMDPAAYRNLLRRAEAWEEASPGAALTHHIRLPAVVHAARLLGGRGLDGGRGPAPASEHGAQRD
ncbi:lonely Cys domain-containing protein [Streptomyces sp. NPDC048279]|uniref:lonely Cys domain-containing protein n=1 Tax=Streptomyces sp. NPDC048279 TaxID=3154714 RepID=UPI00343A3280